MSDQQENMIIPLTDENGDVQDFVVLDAIEIEELGQYVMVAPADADEDDEGIDVIILKVIPGEEEDVFASIDDEDEMEQVFNQFKERWDEEAEEVEEDQ